MNNVPIKTPSGSVDTYFGSPPPSSRTYPLGRRAGPEWADGKTLMIAGHEYCIRPYYRVGIEYIYRE